jgi:hypothetical protein
MHARRTVLHGEFNPFDFTQLTNGPYPMIGGRHSTATALLAVDMPRSA